MNRIVQALVIAATNHHSIALTVPVDEREAIERLFREKVQRRGFANWFIKTANEGALRHA